MDIGALGEYVKSHPKAAAGAAIVGGGAVLYGITHKRAAAKEETSATSAEPVPPSDLSNQYGQPNDYANYPVINIQPSLNTPTPAEEPTRSYNTIFRDGRAVKVTAGPPGICPPGYVAAQQPGQPVRCTLVNDAKKKEGQRTSFVPSMGQSAT